MEQEIQSMLRDWLEQELPGYVRECGGDYRYYLVSDAVAEFFPDGSEAVRQAAADFCYAVLWGTITDPLT